RNDPSALCHWTVPPSSATNTSPGPNPLLETVTVTAAEVPVLLAASRAMALSVCVPAVAVLVFQLTEYGAVVSSAPRAPPSSWNWTPATPPRSEELAVTVTGPDTVAPELGEVIATVGGMTSRTVTVTAEEVAVLLAASRAIA